MRMQKYALWVGLVSATLLAASCQPYHRHLHREESSLGGTAVDVETNARCSHIASMFKPDVVRSAQVNASLIGSGSYLYSESYVRVTEPLLVTINQFLLQACIQRELGEISAQEYAQVYRDNSARFIALASGFSAGPTAEAAAAAFDESGLGEIGNVGSMAGGIRAEVESVLSLLGGSQQQVEKLVAQMQEQLLDERSRIPLAHSILALLLVQPGIRPGIPGDFSPRRNHSAERIRGLFVVFQSNKASLSQEDLARMASFAKATCCFSRYVVYGFADVRGSSDHNLALSRLRALQVANALREAAPEASVIEVALGEGDTFGADMRDNRIVYVAAVDASANLDKLSGAVDE